MKKCLNGAILLLSLLVGLMMEVQAQTTPIHLIEGTVTPIGSLEVVEYIFPEANWETYTRELFYENAGTDELYNGKDVKVSSVGGVRREGDRVKSTEEFFAVGSLSDQVKGGYQITPIEGGDAVTVYNTEQKQEGFYLKYYIENVVAVHQDLGELNWEFIGDGLEMDTQAMIIRLKLPLDTKADGIWGRGPLRDHMAFSGKDMGYVSGAMHVAAGTPVGIRMIFDPKIVDWASKKTGLVVKDEIVAHQKGIAKDNNHGLTGEQPFGGMFLQWLVFLPIIFIFTMLFNRQPRLQQPIDYWTEAPREYELPVLTLINQPGEFDRSQRSGRRKLVMAKANLVWLENLLDAVLIGLVKKGVLRICQRGNGGEDYLFIYAEQESPIALSEIEKQALDLFDQTMDGRDSMYLSKLQVWYRIETNTMSDGTRNQIQRKMLYEWFLGRFERGHFVPYMEKEMLLKRWHKAFKKEYYYKIYEKRPLVQGIKWLVMISMFGSIVFNGIWIGQNYMRELDWMVGLFVADLLFKMIGMVWIGDIQKRTEWGNEQYYKVRAYKAHLENQNMAEVTLESVNQWDEDQMHAVLFGINKAMRKAILKM